MTKTSFCIRLTVAILLIAPIVPIATVQKLLTGEDPKWFDWWVDFWAYHLPM